MQHLNTCPNCGHVLRSEKQEGEYSLYIIFYRGSIASEDYKKVPLVKAHFFTLANAILEMKTEASHHMKCYCFERCRGVIYFGKSKVHSFSQNRGDRVL